MLMAGNVEMRPEIVGNDRNYVERGAGNGRK